ncbi:MAG: hypothetical protein ACRYG2_38620, partial [Janthinobacterium lividum]
ARVGPTASSRRSRRTSPTPSTGRALTVELVVVDHGSPDDLVEWIETDPGPAPCRERGLLRLVRVSGPAHWRHSHAKNAAHRAATGDVDCDVDADSFVGPVATSRIDQGWSSRATRAA